MTTTSDVPGSARAALAQALKVIASLAGDGLDSAAQIELVESLDVLESACAAGKSRVSVTFAKDRVDEALAKLPAPGSGSVGAGSGSSPDPGAVIARVQRSLTGELALAHRISPASMARRLSQYRTACAHLPRLAAAWATGVVPARVAIAITSEAHHLTGAQLGVLDERLAPRLPLLTPREATGAVRKFCTEADPETAMRRLRANERNARVSCRPIADGLAQVSIYAPTSQAIGMYAALRKLGKENQREDESLGMAMARNAFERITGYDDIMQVPIEIGLVMTDTTLFTGSGEPVKVTDPEHAAGDFFLPPEFGAEMARAAGSPEALRFVRRLYTDPIDGSLDACDPRRRRFTTAQREFIIRRDQRCATPWCDAPIRDADHAQPYAAGGETSTVNGNGRCRWCNGTKEEPGWISEAIESRLGTPHTIIVTTPSGRTYHSQAPPVLGQPRPKQWSEPPRPKKLPSNLEFRIYHTPPNLILDLTALCE